MVKFVFDGGTALFFASLLNFIAVIFLMVFYFGQSLYIPRVMLFCWYFWGSIIMLFASAFKKKGWI